LTRRCLEAPTYGDPTRAIPTVVHTQGYPPGLYPPLYTRDTHPGMSHHCTHGIPTRACTPPLYTGGDTHPGMHTTVIHRGYPPGHTPWVYTAVTHPEVHTLGIHRCYTPGGTPTMVHTSHHPGYTTMGTPLS